MATLKNRLDAVVRDAQANALDPHPGGTVDVRGSGLIARVGAGRPLDAGHAPVGEGLSHRLDPADAVLAHRAR
jgi:hypothetical protein